MENLRQEFLDQAVSDLEHIQRKLSEEKLTENFRREIFRILHTLKGTSQTFNFNTSGKFAHHLESILRNSADNATPIDEKCTNLLREGLEILTVTFKHADNPDFAENLIADFKVKIKDYVPQSAENAYENFHENLPPEIWRQFSAQERKAFAAQMAGGGKFYEVAAKFDLPTFTEEFPRLRERLNTLGEVIAVFPQTAFAEKNKIGFRIFLTSKWVEKEFAEVIKNFNADLTYFDFENNFTADLQGVLAQAVSAGEKTARRLDKEIKIETAANDFEVSGKYLNAISHILLHLVRNAADHAIEKTGRIKIQLLSENDNLILQVSDDGRGLDAEKIRAEAVAKKLVEPDKILSRDETFELIFMHGFSTSESVSEISGRGVGLDVVRDTVEKLNGKIRVESDPSGTTFEIVLPMEK